MKRLHANLLLLITALIWGLAFVAQHTSMESVGPYFFNAVRFLLGGLVIVPFAAREYRKVSAQGEVLSTGFWLTAVLCGVFIFLASITQQIGMVVTTVTNAGFLTGLYVIFTPLFLLVFWRKAAHWAIWPSAVGCLVGAYFLSGGQFSSFNQGDLLMIVSATFWALQIIMVGVVVKSTQASVPVLIATVQFLACALFSFGGFFAFETVTWQGVESALTEILYVGVLSVGLGFTIQVVAQRYTGQADAAIIMSGEMLFAALAGALFLAERLSFEGYIGCVIMFASILSVELLPLLRKKKTLPNPSVS